MLMKIFLLVLLFLIYSTHSYRPVTCDQVSCPFDYKCHQGEELAVKCVKTHERHVRCSMVNCGDGQRCVEREPIQPDTDHRRVECIGNDEEIEEYPPYQK